MYRTAAQVSFALGCASPLPTPFLWERPFCIRSCMKDVQFVGELPVMKSVGKAVGQYNLRVAISLVLQTSIAIRAFVARPFPTNTGVAFFNVPPKASSGIGGIHDRARLPIAFAGAKRISCNSELRQSALDRFVATGAINNRHEKVLRWDMAECSGHTTPNGGRTTAYIKMPDPQKRRVRYDLNTDIVARECDRK
jgi:hypothetical protein